MPKYINDSIRKSIDKITDMDVKLAENNDVLSDGTIYIAPSEKHIKLEDNKKIVLFDSKKVNYAKPSIDVFMKSLKKERGVEIIGIILSGVGFDGAEGISHIKKIGGKTFVQRIEGPDTLKGMGESAIKTGCVDKEIPVEEIRKQIFGKNRIKKIKPKNKENNLVVIGSSTGGPRILKRLFRDMPKINSPIILVQHMPIFMNDSLKKSIERITDMNVKIAEDKEILENGTIYIAPSEVHLKIVNNMQVRLEKSEKVNYVCPSIDVTMESLKKDGNRNIFGVILTGMGKDGAKGLSYIKKIGGKTFAQDKDSCVIYGMPRAAYETGSVDFVLSPEEIKNIIVKLTGKIK